MRVAHNGLATNKPVALGFRLNWNVEVLVFVEGGKPENSQKNSRRGDENQRQTNPHNMTVGVGIKHGSHWLEASALTTAQFSLQLTCLIPCPRGW